MLVELVDVGEAQRAAVREIGIDASSVTLPCVSAAMIGASLVPTSLIVTTAFVALPAKSLMVIVDLGNDLAHPQIVDGAILDLERPRHRVRLLIDDSLEGAEQAGFRRRDRHLVRVAALSLNFSTPLLTRLNVFSFGERSEARRRKRPQPS